MHRLWLGVLAGLSLLLAASLHAADAPAPLLRFTEQGPFLAFGPSVELGLNFAEESNVASARVYLNGKEIPKLVDATQRQQKIRLSVEKGKSIVEVAVTPKDAAQQSLVSPTQVHRLTIVRVDAEAIGGQSRKVEFKDAAEKKAFIERLKRREGILTEPGE